MSEQADGQLDTPAMRQYKAFKEQYPDYLLLFRMGDFYETFYDDAKEASRILGVALTARSKGPNAVPLAGIPYHALDGYLARLIKAGCRVAICEQVEDPKQAKGLVKRDVVRLMTPGTLTEQELLDQREGNYLAAIFSVGGQSSRGSGATGAAGAGASAGLAWVELSSGAFWAAIVPQENLLDEITRIRPAELLIAEGGSFDNPSWRELLKQCSSAVATSRPAWAFDKHASVEALKSQFQAATLEGFGFPQWDESVSAAGAIIDYLKETQRTAIAHILSLRKFDRAGHMVLDGSTLRSLEIHRTMRGDDRAGSLLACLDTTRTGMGARLLERWLTFPLTNYSQIVARQDAVEELVGARGQVEEIRKLLEQVWQIDRIAANIAMGRVRPRELVALGNSLRILPQLRTKLGEFSSELLLSLAPTFDGLDVAADIIERSIHSECPNVLRDGGVIADGYDAELDRLRRIGSDGQSWLAEYQAKIIQETGISSLKVGFNQVFGYYIEVTHVHAEKIPAGFVRKQTLKNAERYITDELKKYEAEALTAEERAKKLEAELFERVRAELATFVPAIQRAAESVAALDVLASMADNAIERGYRRPVITQENVLEIIGGKHPVLDLQLREKFVPNDVKMGAADDRLLVITGPNMAGKSTYIRQAALLTLIAQTGAFVPCESATIGLVDRIFTRVGAADELTRGLSTFMLEMVETANILNNASVRSLVILDEVGRGTSTCDGLSLAWAICEHIALQLRCRAMFATHYHELTELEDLIDGAKNLNVAVREWGDQVVFLHKIIEGGTDRSYGVHVARLAGVPKDVIERARQILPQLQAHVANGLDMPELAHRAKQAAAQMNLFAGPAERVAQELKVADIDNMTPIQAMDLLRKLKSEL